MSDAKNSTRHKSDVVKESTSPGHIKESVKSKRSVNDGLTDPVRDTANDKRHNTGRIVVSRTHSYANGESDVNDNLRTDP